MKLNFPDGERTVLTRTKGQERPLKNLSVAKGPEHQLLVGDVSRKIPALQNATADVDQAAARALGINLTDLRCLEMLLHREQVAAGEVAETLRLTRGAVTALIDRLVRAGLASRNTNSQDRRSVLISITSQGKRRVQSLWDPIQREGEAVLNTYSLEELKVIADFLDQSRALQLKHADRINRGRNQNGTRVRL